MHGSFFPGSPTMFPIRYFCIPIFKITCSELALQFGGVVGQNGQKRSANDLWQSVVFSFSWPALLMWMECVWLLQYLYSSYCWTWSSFLGFLLGIALRLQGMGFLRGAQNFATLEVQVKLKWPLVSPLFTPCSAQCIDSDTFNLILSILIVLRTLGIQTASQNISFMECFQESCHCVFSWPPPRPHYSSKWEINDGGTATWFLWTSTGEADSVDGGILAGTEEHFCHMWVTFSSQALALQLAVQTCHVQTDSLHQSRLIFVPRGIWIYSHLDNVTCGRLGRGQLSWWGNACWPRNDY